MQRNLFGQFVVTAGEHITLKVTKAKDAYMARVQPIQGGPAWESQTMQTPLEEVRTTTAPPAAGTVFTFTIDFDFRPDPSFNFDPADGYTVELSGSTSGSPKPVTIKPPPSFGRGFAFTT